MNDILLQPIDLSVIPAMIAGAFGIGSTLLGRTWRDSDYIQQKNDLIQQRNETWRREDEVYRRQRQDALSDLRNQREYDSPQAQMARFKEAGLNPNLIYGSANGSNASIQAPSLDSSAAPDPPQYSTSEALSSGLAGALQMFSTLKDQDFREKQFDFNKEQRSFDNSMRTQQFILQQLKLNDDLKNSSLGRELQDMQNKLFRTTYGYQVEKSRMEVAKIRWDNILLSQTAEMNKNAIDQLPVDNEKNKLQRDILITQLNTANESLFQLQERGKLIPYEITKAFNESRLSTLGFQLSAGQILFDYAKFKENVAFWLSSKGQRAFEQEMSKLRQAFDVAKDGAEQINLVLDVVGNLFGLVGQFFGKGK